MLARHRKTWIILLSLFSLAALVFLATGLKSLDLNSRPVYRFSFEEAPTRTIPSPLPAAEDTSFLKIVGMILLILIPLVIIYLIISPEGRKRFLVQLIYTAVLLFCLYMISRNIQQQPEEVVNSNAPATGEMGEGYQDLPVIEPFSSESPDWLVYAVSAVVAIILVAIFLRIWLQVQRARREAQTVDWLVDSAQSAIEDIKAGGDFRNIILRCYFDMTQAVQEKRSVIRPDYTTAREFSVKLKSVGLPEEYVLRLTRLFESARYSSHSPTRRQELEAIDCFTAIVDALGGNA
jgi:hypothetical protein